MRGEHFPHALLKGISYASGIPLFRAAFKAESAGSPFPVGRGHSESTPFGIKTSVTLSRGDRVWWLKQEPGLQREVPVIT